MHYRMALIIGIPMILVWVIGFPLITFLIIFNQRHDLNNKEFLLRNGLFFVGLTDRTFFWEVIVSNSRKIIFILCSTFLTME
jgi:hypothetical protein